MWLSPLFTARNMYCLKLCVHRLPHFIPTTWCKGHIFGISSTPIDSPVICLKCKETHLKFHSTSSSDPSLLFFLHTPLRYKGKGTCYSAAYMSQTRDQRCFTVWEVAADWHELMIPWRIILPSIVRANEQLDPRCSTQTYHCPKPH